jgi:hypothetical protein
MSVSSSELGPPHPFPRERVCLPTWTQREDTPLRVRGWGDLIRTTRKKAQHSVYFVDEGREVSRRVTVLKKQKSGAFFLLLFHYGECQRKLPEKISFSGRNEENRQETTTEAEYKSSGPVLARCEGQNRHDFYL